MSISYMSISSRRAHALTWRAPALTWRARRLSLGARQLSVGTRAGSQSARARSQSACARSQSARARSHLARVRASAYEPALTSFKVAERARARAQEKAWYSLVILAAGAGVLHRFAEGPADVLL